MEFTCAGPNCGKTFEATNPRAKYCSSTCRSRGNRAGVDVVELRPAPGTEPATSTLVDVTRRELETADALDSVLGQQALALAERITSPHSTSASVASLVKEMRAVMAEATAHVKVASDPLDELRARRDRKRTG